jgi:hypothetical protein
LDMFRTAYHSPNKLKEELEGRYSVFLDFGFHRDEPMDAGTFEDVVGGRMEELQPDRLQTWMESAHVVPGLCETHFCSFIKA